MDIKIPSKYLILRKPRVANFAETIKMGTIFNKITFKDSRMLKE